MQTLRFALVAAAMVVSATAASAAFVATDHRPAS
jgi:hypothetical protein